jgi:hypothetical protein
MPPPPTEAINPIWAAAGTLVAAGIGAFIASFVAEFVKGRSRKSQYIESARDEDLARILLMVAELETLATDYWTESGPSLAEREILLRARIVARQQHLLELIAHLFNGDAKRECDVVVTDLLDAIGGGDFGDPDREAQPERLTGVYQYGLKFGHLAQKMRRSLKRGMLA